MITDKRITAAQLASSLFVKTTVWVRKPGPTADVAIRNAAPKKTCRFIFFCKRFYLGD
jgi:hypothetical protein